ncbi:Arc family DNA-binding protein [Sinorhizobium sp. 8-89]|uniref:Arc family DNA-binding protein n=1 Tax=Sinorhizobium sp. 7-81 TaxID=3049087 RepID=UPI0024C23AF3|nr:Arc family DNA-binding protein [Sinorhizobium sp. 7-81]MDK1386339.1 Arc family DNA-binding protein [Sinorhizobium sp. 7-81]
MAREDLHFRLRIPEDLKNRIEDAAASNKRSITAEMIDRLETSFQPVPTQIQALITEFTHQLIVALDKQDPRRKSGPKSGKR